MKDRIVIIGASGHGKVVADIAKKNGYTKIVFLDDNDSVKVCDEYKVVGTTEDVTQYKEWDFVVAIGNAQIRRRIQTQLIETGFRVVSLIHPDAIIADSAVIGEGTVIMAGAVVNPCTRIGKGSIINTCASVDHDCVVGDFSHISVGAHIAGTVLLGEHTWIGAGATVINNIEVTSDCVVGAGAVVVKSIEEPGTYIGMPAKMAETTK